MILYFSGTGNSRYAAEFLAQALGDQAEDVGPVSYTHLDVYKRQREKIDISTNIT